MPLFFQQQLHAETQFAIWKIEEPEPFFNVPLQRSITHPHKRLQHLAGRYLLRYLEPQFPLHLIKVASTRKPYLYNEAFHFSISHCADFAAVIISRTSRVGIDIELVTRKVARIQHKFAQPAELDSLTESNGFDETPHGLLKKLTLLWSCKEAVFKWYGAGEVDFKKHIQLTGARNSGAELFEIPMLFMKGDVQALDLHARFINELCVSYVVT